MRARITANMSATKNPSMWNPGTIFVTKRTIRILITREKSPSVRILSGSVSILRKTQIVLLTTASTTATMIAVRYPSTEAPGVIYAAIATAIPDIRILIRIFIWYGVSTKRLNELIQLTIIHHISKWKTYNWYDPK